MEQKKLNDKELFDFLVAEADKPFLGWDFSDMVEAGRIVESLLEWSYTSKILFKLRKVESLLDMGTGGDGYLALLQPLPKNTYATETYRPNLKAARERLKPIEVKVIEVDDENRLPFRDSYFDLVINKQRDYLAEEIFRILHPKAEFITQQIGSLNNIKLNELFGVDIDSSLEPWNLSTAVEELEAAGMEILEQQESFPMLRFYDVGAIVYYLKAVSYKISDFGVEKYFDQLKEIYLQIEANGYIDIKGHKFIIVAEKKAN